MIVSSYSELYSLMRDLFLKKAPVVSSRICDTKEFIGFNFELTNPRARLGYNARRGFNLPFALSEFIFDVAGVNDVFLSASVNAKTLDYSDDGNTFHGAYGPKISPNIGRIIEMLKVDKNCRQAVITIYNSTDMYVKTKDIPCTLSLQFLIRNDKLNMICSMRSNDFFFGLQYDLFRFTMLQELIANELGIDVGSYYHLAGSMHVYKYHWEMLEDILEMESILMPELNMRVCDCFKVARQMYGLSCGSDTCLDNDIIKIIATRYFDNYEMPVSVWAERFVGKK